MRPWIFGLVALTACSGATYQGAAGELRPLERVRAQRVIEEALRSRGLAPEAGRTLRITGRRAVECDVAIAGARSCVEYMNAADRARYGSSIPAHNSPDALVVVATTEGDAGGHVLALDDRDYSYEPDPNRTGPGRASIGEVEDRLRRTVIDFAVWLREQPAR